MSKKKQFRFTFSVFLRLVIFFLIIYFSIKYLASQSEHPVIQTLDSTLTIDEETKNNILQNIYQKLPENSRYQIEHINENQSFIYIQNQLNGFPGKQIKEIQKLVVKNVSDTIIDNIDKN